MKHTLAELAVERQLQTVGTVTHERANQVAAATGWGTRVRLLANDKYLLETKIQYNNDNKRQNILGERYIL